MTVLHRTRLDLNVARFYGLGLEKSLFGEFLVIRVWGRIGNLGRSLTERFNLEAEAEQRVQRLAAIKRRRGYVDQRANERVSHGIG